MFGKEKIGENLQDILELVKTGIQWIYDNFSIFNIFFAIAIVFFQRKSPKEVWAWLLLLYFIPIVGFLLYMVVHQDMHKKHMFRIKEIEDELNYTIRKQEQSLHEKRFQISNPNMEAHRDLVMYNLETGGAVYTEDNSVDIYTDGREKFQRLIEEIDKAEQFIHIQYYIIQKDELFENIKAHLVKKVKQGVEVRILYDSMGCRSMRRSDWKWLEQHGIKTGDFFPASLKWLHVRVNYRNHRKIVVIDGKVGFIGGYNIGREYISLDEKFGYWRDTHLVLYGSAVNALQVRFALDWNYATKENLFLQQKYFQDHPEQWKGKTGIQIITSGPDSKFQQIRDNYVSLMHKAKKRIYVQTPYFIPDETILSALMIAVKSGVDVRIMIPCKPDHPFVYWATYSYMGELLQAGARCYTYEDGFLHAKGITVDGAVTCYRTANMDIRSFMVNFEVNATIYDAEVTRKMEAIFRHDITHCKEVTLETYNNRSFGIRVKEQLFRLLSPVL